MKLQVRSTTEERNTRLKQFEALLLAGKTKSQVIDILEIGDWNHQTLANYFNEAWRRIGEANDTNFEQNRAKTLKRLENYIERCQDAGDRKNEAKAIELQAKIYGIFEIRHRHSFEPLKQSTEELAESLETTATPISENSS